MGKYYKIGLILFNKYNQIATINDIIPTKELGGSNKCTIIKNMLAQFGICTKILDVDALAHNDTLYFIFNIIGKQIIKNHQYINLDLSYLGSRIQPRVTLTYYELEKIYIIPDGQCLYRSILFNLVKIGIYSELNLQEYNQWDFPLHVFKDILFKTMLLSLTKCLDKNTILTDIKFERKQFYNFIIESGIEFNDSKYEKIMLHYVKYMLKETEHNSSTWGGTLELNIISLMHDVRIIVLNKDHSATIFVHSNTNKNIFLEFDGSHYNTFAI